MLLYGVYHRTHELALALKAKSCSPKISLDTTASVLEEDLGVGPANEIYLELLTRSFQTLLIHCWHFSGTLVDRSLTGDTLGDDVSEMDVERV